MMTKYSGAKEREGTIKAAISSSRDSAIVRISDKYSLEGWRSQSDDSIDESKGYNSDICCGGRYLGTTDKYDITEKMTRDNAIATMKKYDAIPIQNIDSECHQLFSKSSCSNSEHSRHGVHIESSLTSDAASTDMSSSGTGTLFSDSSLSLFCSTQSTITNRTEREANANIAEEQIAKLKYLERSHYSKSLSFDSGMGIIQCDDVSINERLNIIADTDNEDFYGVALEAAKCGDRIVELHWMFEDECNHMNGNLSPPSKTRNESNSDYYIRKGSNFQYLPSLMVPDARSSIKESSIIHSSSSSFSECSDSTINSDVEGFNYNTVEDTITGRERCTRNWMVPANLTEESYDQEKSRISSERQGAGGGSFERVKFQSQSQSSECAQNSSAKTLYSNPSRFLSDLTKSVSNVLDFSFMHSPCATKKTLGNLQRRESTILKGTSISNNRAITYLYAAIRTHNEEVALAHLKKNPEEATVWVTCLDSIPNKFGAQAPVPVQVLPLHVACFALSPLAFVKELISLYPEAIYKRAGNAKYPIHFACEAGTEPEVVLFLMKKWPGSIYSRDGDGNIPLTTLIKSKPLNQRKTEIMTVLLAAFEEQKLKAGTQMYNVG